MAERTIVEVVDDLDETVIADGTGERIPFSVRGVDYVIDLKAANAAKFDKALLPFIEAATKVGGRRKSAGPAVATTVRNGTGSGLSREQLTAIRDWARTKGYEVSARGRIKTEIVDAFNAEHS